MIDPATHYAAIVESTDDVVIAKSLDGTVLSWNPAAERILGWTAPEMIGKSIRTIIPSERQDEEDAILARIQRGERVERFETVRLARDGRLVPLAIQVSPVRNAQGTVVGASKIARDITPELTARQTRLASEERFKAMGDNLPVMAWIGDRDGILRWGNAQFRQFFGVTQDDIAGFDWASRIVEDYRAEIADTIHNSIGAKGGWSALMPMVRAADKHVCWMLANSVPLADETSGLYLRFGTATDITAQREAEDRVRALLKEINHRTRNMLATIQSMAKRTAASGGDFVLRLEGRIAGLAATQDLLVEHDWDGVPLDALVRAQLEVTGQSADRVALRGPALLLSPGAADAIGMAINELALNGASYGALSVPEGRVELTCGLTGSQMDQVFTIEWRERGGPKVVVPDVTGFGSRIINEVPKGKLCGEVEVTYDSLGLQWRLSCPARLALAANRPE